MIKVVSVTQIYKDGQMIDGNIVRMLQRIKTNPADAAHLVDPEYISEIIEVLKPCESVDVDSQFDLQAEFRVQYTIVKSYISSMGQIDSKEDLDVMKEAQKFLTFLLRNEEKLNDIQAVKDFKEAVLDVLDEEDEMLRDRVIKRLGAA